MKVHNRFCIALVAAVIVLYAAIAPSAGMTGAIEGIAFDPVTGKRIPDVRVEMELGLETYRTVTDSVGAFSLSGLPEGVHFTVTAVKPGFRTTLLTVSVVAGKTSRMEFSMPSVHLELFFPGDGEHLIAGTFRNAVIWWESIGVEDVRIEFSPNGGGVWYPLALEVRACDGFWKWSVPDIPTAKGLIRIIALDCQGLSDRNNAPFLITSTGVPNVCNKHVGVPSLALLERGVAG